MSNPLVEKFSKLETSYNKNLLVTLDRIKKIVEDEEDPKDKEQFTLLQEAYDEWFYIFNSDPRCMEACEIFYDATEERHALLLARDEQLFTYQDQDFFALIFNKPGLDSAYLYSLLDDGLDDSDDDEEEEEKVAPGEDAKSNLWNALIGLYRLSVLICIYLKMPLVKDIIDMILIDNPDLNQSNIFDKIFGQFKSNPRMRKMIMRLLKSKEDSFGSIFNNLQRVIASFGDGSAGGWGSSGSGAGSTWGAGGGSIGCGFLSFSCSFSTGLAFGTFASTSGSGIPGRRLRLGC